MKQVKNILVVAAFLVMGANLATAQTASSKVCHIASQELVEELPKAKAAEKQLRNLAKAYEADLVKMDRELKVKAQEAQQNAPNRSDEENERKYQEIQQDRKTLEDFYSKSQESLAQKRTDLLKPLYEEVRQAIFKVARAKGFDYVLDSTTGTGVIMADGYDLMPDVKAALGI
ncbi:OmpH family outer membrane protein [Nonlabens ponticola]|uniref:OmpH family outer membrane protein n=1 Tax=Nonlabens ponticola TaxID=2496866 RepID=A0A3S9MUZ3_9FLAO|nr:OmpH family outer membrane protein [Nonlabens ponticola]AZQ42999.1 OmpH family outer membrane protein [Nonlabens ponticola]